MKNPSLGEQERELLRFIGEQSPATTSEVAERFGEPRGLARTTVVTMMERLRRKGYLTRRRRRGVFHYAPIFSEAQVMEGLVRHFVENTLGGSLAPVVAYLARTRQLSPAEQEDLRQLVEAMKAEAAPAAGEGEDGSP